MPPSSPELARRALSWLASHLDHFRVPIGAGAQPFVRGVKMVSELAQTADLLLGSSLVDPAMARTWIEGGWQELQRGEHFLHALSFHEHFVLLAAAYATFAKHGHRNADFEAELVARSARIELPPHYRFHLAWAMSALGLPCPIAVDAALADTPLGRRQDPRTLTLEDAYSMTHTLFYLTDWGRRRGAVSAETREYILGVAPGLMSRCVNAGNMDLLGELISALDVVGADCAPERMWQAFEGSQEADGSLPPPSSNYSRRWGTFSLHRMRVLEKYHPTIVAVTTAVMCPHGLR